MFGTVCKLFCVDHSHVTPSLALALPMGRLGKAAEKTPHSPQSHGDSSDPPHGATVGVKGMEAKPGVVANTLRPCSSPLPHGWSRVLPH